MSTRGALAEVAADSLAEIASLLLRLPRDEYSLLTVSFGVSRAASDLLVQLGGTRGTAVYTTGEIDDGPSAIDSVELTVDGVIFRAQYDKRVLTDEELRAVPEAAPAFVFSNPSVGLYDEADNSIELAVGGAAHFSASREPRGGGRR